MLSQPSSRNLKIKQCVSPLSDSTIYYSNSAKSLKDSSHLTKADLDLSESIASNGQYSEDRSLEDRILAKSKEEINKRDIFGRTLLHIAASIGRTDLLSVLLQHPHIDVKAIDYESGWTALHRALYFGNIACAQQLLAYSFDLIKSKDRNKDTPFDVVNSTIDQSFKPWDNKRGGTELFMFGSNANHTLGFADSDDRASPEIVKINRDPEILPDLPRHRFKPLRIEAIEMAKLHTAVLTTDRIRNLYMCGVARGGRLGLGSHRKSTQFALVPLQSFSNSRIIAIALGQDHSVAISERGVCYTWGSNNHGQLGYQLEKYNNSNNVDEPGVQYTPRQVASSELDRSKLYGCAASRIHTVVYNDNEIFFWGRNVGQMGFYVNSDDGDSNITTSPRRLTYMPSSPLMVKASDIATVVLWKTLDVFVYINGGYFKVLLPGPSLNNSRFEVFKPRNASRPAKICRISLSSRSYVCLITDNGSVFRFSLDQYQNIKVSQISKNLKVSKVWVGRKLHQRATDVGVADDGSVIICTRSGSVWKMAKRTKMGLKSRSDSREYKFERAPLINRILQVRCDANFGSFAAIRDDIPLAKIKIDTQTIEEDMISLLPFDTGYNFPKAPQIQQDSAKRFLDYYVFGPFDIQNLGEEAAGLYRKDSNSDPGGVDAENNEYEHQTDEQDPILPSTDLRIVHRNGIIQQYNYSSWEAKVLDILTFSNSVPQPICDLNDARKYDLLMPVEDGVHIPSHKLILSHIVGGFLVEKNPPPIESERHNIKISLKESMLSFEGVLPQTVFILLYYVYTGKWLRAWRWSYASTPKHIEAVKSQLHNLKRVIHLHGLEDYSIPDHSERRNASLDLVKDTEFTDVLIYLSDGNVQAHSFILSSRSGFFGALLSQRWSSERGANGLVEVHLEDISSQVFEIVIRHIYGDLTLDIFDISVFDTFKQLSKFVMQVLKVADQLLLPKLKDLCQLVLIHSGKIYV